MSLFFDASGRVRTRRGGMVAKGFSLVLAVVGLVYVGISVANLLPPDLLVRTGWSGSTAAGWNGGGMRSAERVPTLPAFAGLHTQHFAWQYQGQAYTLDVPLYTSVFAFYQGLPTGVPLASGASQDGIWWSGLNQLFLTPARGDTSMTSVAQSLRDLGQAHHLTDDQLVELVATFVQSIPYDQEKTDRRTAGQNGDTEKTTYPYEVLSENTGVCQDKSYLAYRLLQELGYGVALFLFPDPKDNHMAVGVACPAAFDNYDSGYCFLETTSTGNKIGIIPSLVPQSRVATALIKMDDIQTDSSANGYQPLGQVEVLNAITGKSYTGIVETLKQRDALVEMQKAIYRMKQDLDQKQAKIVSEEALIDQYDDRMTKLKRTKHYAEYNSLVKPYNELVDQLQGHVSAYNRLVRESNTLIRRYNTESQLFYAP